MRAFMRAPGTTRTCDLGITIRHIAHVLEVAYLCLYRNMFGDLCASLRTRLLPSIRGHSR